jgi:anti-sigma-K factor RskA
MLHAERECAHFTKWIPGLSPKEHIDMTIIEENRHFQEELLRKQAEREDRRDTKNFRLNCALVIVAVVSVIVAVVSAVAACWSATHPTVIPIPQLPAAAAAPIDTPRPQEAKQSPPAKPPAAGSPTDTPGGT